MNFEEIKLAIAKIQFENLHLNADKTAIEANPSTHKIAEWIRNNFVPAETLVMPKITDGEEKFFGYIMESLQEYWETQKGKGKAVVYVRNDETGQLVIYTRGEYGEDLIKFIKNLDINYLPKIADLNCYNCQSCKRDYYGDDSSIATDTCSNSKSSMKGQLLDNAYEFFCNYHSNFIV